MQTALFGKRDKKREASRSHPTIHGQSWIENVQRLEFNGHRKKRPGCCLDKIFNTNRAKDKL